MEVTFDVVRQEKSWGDNQYDLDVLIDGKRTGIQLEVGSGNGSVEARIILFYGDVIDGTWMEGTISVPRSDKHSHIWYEIHLDGNVGHLKKYVSENIIEILKIMHPKMKSFKHDIVKSVDLVENALLEDMKCHQLRS